VQAVHSAVASDLLVLRVVRAGRQTAAFVSVATSDAEDAASSAASAFLSIQPPDVRSQRLRDRLASLLDRAVTALGDARVAGRTGDDAGLLRLRATLAAVDRDLRAFTAASS
jgi:hypothetical protein